MDSKRSWHADDDDESVGVVEPLCAVVKTNVGASGLKIIKVTAAESKTPSN
jgi:hypothetical protein